MYYMKQADRALARSVGGWPPGVGCKGAVSLCLRKFCILQAKLCIISSPFSLNLQKYIIFGGRKGAALAPFHKIKRMSI